MERYQDQLPGKFRKTLLIYPRFQLVMIAINAGVMLTMLGLVDFQLERSLESLRQSGIAAGIKPDHVYYRFLDHQAGVIYSYFWWALAAGLVIGTLATLILSHRLAGPIVRLERFFRSIAESEVPREQDFQVRFRRGDFFQELPSTLNDAIRHLQGKTTSSKVISISPSHQENKASDPVDHEPDELSTIAAEIEKRQKVAA